MTAHEKVCAAFEGVGFFICLAAILSLFLVGCGQERPLDASAAESRPSEGARPPPPEAIRLEVCTVTLHDDGTASCACEVKR